MNASQAERDAEQDRQIAANSAAIELMTKYLQDLRDHFEPILGMVDKVPRKWKRLVRVSKIFVTIGVAGMAAAKFGVWYLQKQKLHRMADRYAQVAKTLYYSENNPDVALPFVDKALNIEGESPEYIFLRAYMQGMSATRSLLNLGRPFSKDELNAAHSALAEALYLQGLAPKRPEPYILQAQIRSALGDREAARAAIDRAVELAPENDFARVRLAMIQMDAGEVEAAEKSLDRALELNPGSKWAWLWKGVICSECRMDYAQAAKFNDKALEIDPKFDMGLYNRGNLFMMGKRPDYDAARRFMLKALKVNPAYKEACYSIGMTYGYENNYAIAKVWLDKAVALDPMYLKAWKWRGIVNGEMGLFADAIADFNVAIELDPMNPTLYAERAEMQLQKGNVELAMRDLRFSLGIDPSRPQTHCALGELYLQIGDDQLALDSFDGALSAGDRFEEAGDAYEGKAKVLLKLGRNEEALATVGRALEVSTLNVERIWMTKGRILEAMSRLEDALAAYEKARSLNSELDEAWRKEAELAKRLGMTERSERAMAAYRKLKPTER